MYFQSIENKVNRLISLNKESTGQIIMFQQIMVFFMITMMSLQAYCSI